MGSSHAPRDTPWAALATRPALVALVALRITLRRAHAAIVAIAAVAAVAAAIALVAVLDVATLPATVAVCTVAAALAAPLAALAPAPTLVRLQTPRRALARAGPAPLLALTAALGAAAFATALHFVQWVPVCS